MTLVRCETTARYREFRVRREKILEALDWFKQNNVYYRDIGIDLAEINALASGDEDVS